MQEQHKVPVCSTVIRNHTWCQAPILSPSPRQGIDFGFRTQQHVSQLEALSGFLWLGPAREPQRT